MSAMQKVKDALLKAGFSGEKSRECAEGGEKTPRSPHVAMDFVRRALDSAAPWWQTQGAAPKDGERIVNSPVEKETKPTALGAGRHMEAMQRKAGSRPPIGKLPDTPKGMDEALVMDGMAMDAGEMASAATQMMSELEKHDKQHHPGGYKGGTCKLRDKMAQAAKNIGMSPKAVEKITKRTSGAEGEGTPAPEAPSPDDSPEFKEFNELRQKIMADTRAANEGKTEEEQKQNVKAAIEKLRSARFDYLTKALKMSPAEAGACSEIVERVESGSEEAKNVVEALPDEQKKIIDAVTAKEGGPEQPDSSEGVEQAETPSGAQARDDPDAKFAAELKGMAPEHEEMIDTLTAKFDGLNTALTEEQKKQFWELNEGGDEEAFYKFLGDVGKFAPKEVDALRALTDAYREANPDQYPEYAKQHQYDKLRREVFKKDHRLKSALAGNGSKKPLSAQGLADKLVGKGLDKDSIVAFMKSEGIDEELATAIVNGDPVDPELDLKEAERIAEKDKLAKKRAELSKAEFESKEKYNRAKDKAEKERKRGDPDTEKKLKKLYDKWKAARDANAAFKQNPTLEPAAAPAPVQAPAPEPPTESQPQAESQAPAPAPAQSHAATKEDVAKQSADDPVEEGDTPEDHAKVCKANPKSNCPFLKAHMTKEQRAALDNPQKAEGAAPAPVSAPAPEPKAETPSADVPPAEQPSDGQPDAASAATPEPEQPTPAPAPADGQTLGPDEQASPPEAQGEEASGAEAAEEPPPEPLPEYKPPKIGDSEFELEDIDKSQLNRLREAYQNATGPEERERIRADYETMMKNLDMAAAHLDVANKLQSDKRALEEEAKRPGFIQNLKNFFGGIAKSLKGDRPIGRELSMEERNQLGLPKTGTIRTSEYTEALKRNSARNARKAEAEKAEAERGAAMKQLTPPKDVTLADESLLEPATNEQASHDEAVKYANKIKDKFNKSKLDVTGIESVSVGPSATSVEMKVGDGFDINKAKRMIDNLASTGVSVSSIEFVGNGKEDTIRVDFTNNKMATVKMADVMNSKEWQTAKSQTGIPVAVGKDSAGKPIVKNLAKMPHTLITGGTGSGKSVCLQSLINSAQMAKTPKEYRQVCIDGKGNEFGSQGGSPYNLYPVANGQGQKGVEAVSRILSSLRKEMEDRAAKLGVSLDDYDETKNVYKGDVSRSLDDYNKKVGDDKKLPYIATYIDELATFTKDPKYGKQIEDDLDQLLAKARSVGMNFVLSTQRGDVDSVPGRLKSNIPGRFIFKAVPGDTIAPEEAQSLKGDGDMIVIDKDGNETRGRGTFLSDNEIEAIGSHYRKQNPGSVPKPKPVRVGSFRDGMEVYRDGDRNLTYQHNGKQYVPVEVRGKGGKIGYGWRLADGSDPTVYGFKRPTSSRRT